MGTTHPIRDCLYCLKFQKSLFVSNSPTRRYRAARAAENVEKCDKACIWINPKFSYLPSGSSATTSSPSSTGTARASPSWPGGRPPSRPGSELRILERDQMRNQKFLLGDRKIANGKCWQKGGSRCAEPRSWACRGELLPLSWGGGLALVETPQRWANNSVFEYYSNTWGRILVFVFGWFLETEYYSYSYSGDFLKTNIIRIRIRVIFWNRILFVFVFGWFSQTE